MSSSPRQKTEDEMSIEEFKEAFFVCVEYAAFGKRNADNIPEKLVQMAPILARDLTGPYWAHHIVGLLNGDNKPAKDMNRILQLNPSMWKWNDAIWSFFWYFRIAGTCGEHFDHISYRAQDHQKLLPSEFYMQFLLLLHNIFFCL